MEHSAAVHLFEPSRPPVTTNLERLAGLSVERDRRHDERFTEALKHLVILLDLSLPNSHGLEGANLEMARRATPHPQ